MAEFSVVVDGADITARLEPIVTAIRIRDVTGASTDTAEVQIWDDLSIKLPRKGVGIEIALADATGLGIVFRGKVDAVRSRGGRSGGRALTISAKGADVAGKVKALRSRHWDGASLASVLDQAARDAGLSGASVDDKFSDRQMGYVAQHGESFLAFGQRLAREVGGTFKIAGDTAYLLARGGGRNARGRDLPTVTAEYGVNLVEWDIDPDASRAAYGSTAVRVYDPQTGGWKTSGASTKGSRSDAEHRARYPAATEDDAAARAEADAGEADRKAASGSVRILADVRARSEAQCLIKGARPGVDGAYRITAVEHAYERGQGVSTNIELGEPSGSAGVDDR